MASNLTQSANLGIFFSDLGDDVLAIESFKGTEGISELFEYSFDLVSEKFDIDVEEILGTNCQFQMQSVEEGVIRYFEGVLVETRWNGYVQDLLSFTFVLRPWFWLLTKTNNCRIYHNKSVVDVIQDVFGKHDFAVFKNKLSQSYPVLEYCVQYCESDYAFVSRLMEEYGIYYFFEHSEEGHAMVLADAQSAHVAKSGNGKLNFVYLQDKVPQGTELLTSVVPIRLLRSGKFSMKDYDYHKPTKDMNSSSAADATYANSMLEVYTYPGRYVEKSVGESLTKVKLEAEDSQDGRVRAQGNAINCTPGYLADLINHNEADLNGKYLIVRASHQYRTSIYRTGSEVPDNTYEGSYDLMTVDLPFRAQSTTPKPRILGPQTAFVVSEVDDKCRIKVKFHWQREDGESRYVRISHGWSGGGWGDQKIPRIGMEVIVEYLDGDPDQPMVTGCVYNGDNKSPYNLPAEKTISGTKSQTYDGAGYNEFILDDKAGSELIRMHGQKDLDITIRNNSETKIGVNSKLNVGTNSTESIGSVWSASAGAKIEFSVGQSKIVMEPTKITITSPEIKLESTLKSDYLSSGLTTMTGALVKIN
jgi:type VI secretion system secreted protein VgrG